MRIRELERENEILRL